MLWGVKMPSWQSQDTTQLSDVQYQDYILQGVSRTFALTIPQMPQALELVTGNAYLLCRIADTIEDDVSLSAAQKHQYIDQFLEVIAGRRSAQDFAQELLPLLAAECPTAELDLVKHAARVIRISHSFTALQQSILLRCVTVMAAGMAHFQALETPFGLADMPQLDRYCYHVAGVVGEMLTSLFCDYSDEMALQQPQLMQLSLHFGQGLQMTNILKDVREDMSRGVNWLPRELFTRHNINLDDLPAAFEKAEFSQVIGHLIGVAHHHLRKALDYTLMIPVHEKGLRRFCLWAIAMAVKTLAKINEDRHYHDSAATKITRGNLRRIIFLCNISVHSDGLSKLLFARLARSLPAPEYCQLEVSALNVVH
jgi:farnesyl-diphosphate farnesyltransferase